MTTDPGKPHIGGNLFVDLAMPSDNKKHHGSAIIASVVTPTCSRKEPPSYKRAEEIEVEQKG